MAFFSYKALTDDGQKSSGLVEAASLPAAAKILRDRTLYVVSIKPQRTFFNLSSFKGTINRVRFGDVVQFTRQLATMINAGLPLTNALDLLSKQMGNPAMVHVVSELLRDIEGGSNLSKSMAKFPHVFSSTYIALVRAGEAAGILDNILLRLADTLEKNKEFKGKVKGAFIYPAIIVSAMFAVSFIMMVFVVPKLTAMYADMGVELPFQTVFLMQVSDFFVNFWFLIIALIIGAIVAFKRWHATAMGRYSVDKIILSLPIVGPLVKKVILVEFTRTLGILIGAGVPVISALTIVADSLDNALYQRDMKLIISQVEKGFTLSEPIAQNPLFPPIVSQMIAVGEETGKIDETLLKLSTYFELEADQSIKGLTIAIEPLIMMVMGVGVGLLVWAVLSPIWSLTSSL